jgi:hypothetical protein
MGNEGLLVESYGKSICSIDARLSRLAGNA